MDGGSEALAKYCHSHLRWISNERGQTDVAGRYIKGWMHSELRKLSYLETGKLFG